ncbi:hypothetical protein N7466_005217 [Penicillium verhagenii]|uniref:uncharacterized protein n=1 Tax=Penicillium verhagenii TaxID=1562060 RepID=UPI002544FE49|nr:uncharacterized protein N7466_005217 [Penicillium verhagenii]KAJ5935670.1 hypothetical protein N7466_005217 [Penicillium verhagenii]
MLLSLPPEIIQLILRKCDGPSFLQAAFSCRSLLALATSSRDLVRYQLLETPGPSSNIDAPLPTRKLFQLLLQQSHRELYGVNFQFERKIFSFGGKVVDSRASSIIDAGSKKQIMLVFTDDPTVYLLDIQDGALTLQRQIESPAKQFGDVQIVHTALNQERAYVLHRLQPFNVQEPVSNHPFVKQALQSNPNGSIFLACYDLNPENNVIYTYGFPEEKDYNPLSFAVENDQFAISWQHVQKEDNQVVLYTMTEFGNELDSEEADPAKRYEDQDDDHDMPETDARRSLIIASKYTYLVLAINNTCNPDYEITEPTVKLTFNDRGQQLLHHSRGQTLYNSFQRLNESTQGSWKPTKKSTNACAVALRESLSLSFSIGIPFFAAHKQIGGQYGRIRCCWQYLAVGIATHRVEHWSVGCVLRSSALPMSHNCSHVVNLDRGRRLNNWEVVALLEGFQETSTSQGSLIATSRQGTRIAIASWKTVSIWALEPTALTDGLDYHFYPTSWYTAEGYPGLRPAVIELDAVCSQLQFTENENELAAITGRGLLSLRLKPDGRGIQLIDSPADDILKGKVNVS